MFSPAPTVDDSEQQEHMRSLAAVPPEQHLWEHDLAEARALENQSSALAVGGYTNAQRAAREQPLIERAAQLEQDMSRLEVPGIVKPRVPGGGLAAHEARGAHVLDRHVGKDDADLLSRLATGNIQPGPDGIRRASAWATLDDAEAAVAEVMNANTAQIQAFMAGPDNILEMTGRSAVAGRSLGFGQVTSQEVHGVTMVLLKDANSPLGYRILTAYPMP